MRLRTGDVITEPMTQADLTVALTVDLTAAAIIDAAKLTKLHLDLRSDYPI